MTIRLSDDACQALLAIIADGQVGIPFDLSPAYVEYLLKTFNIKVQAADVGFVCFQSIKVGTGTIANTSGEAFAKFLVRNGCKLSGADVSADVHRFCEQAFR